MLDAQVEETLFPLLENHSFDEILQALSGYVNTQAQLAQLLQEDGARRQWICQAMALEQACEVLQDKMLLVSAEFE